MVNTNLHFDFNFQNCSTVSIVYYLLPKGSDHAVALHQVGLQDMIVTVMNISIHQVDMVLRAFQFQLMAVNSFNWPVRLAGTDAFARFRFHISTK